jgi:hypothetical protein
MSGPIRQPLADVTTVTPTLSDKAVTIQANTVRTSLYSAIYNLFKTGFDAVYATIASVNTKLSLTGGTMSGNIDMSNSLVRGLGAPSENEDAANKLYVDDLVATKQPLFDYLGTGIGTTAVTINDFKGGTATFTQVVNKKSSQYFRINSDQITSATTKIIVTLVYDGAGYPIIASQKLALGRVDILVVNPDILTTGGTNTDVSIDIQYQIVG